MRIFRLDSCDANKTEYECPLVRNIQHLHMKRTTRMIPFLNVQRLFSRLFPNKAKSMPSSTILFGSRRAACVPSLSLPGEGGVREGFSLLARHNLSNLAFGVVPSTTTRTLCLGFHVRRPIFSALSL